MIPHRQPLRQTKSAVGLLATLSLAAALCGTPPSTAQTEPTLSEINKESPLGLISPEDLRGAIERARANPSQPYPVYKPADGVWLPVDEHRRAYVERISKAATGGKFEIREKQVRLSYGLTVDLIADEGDDLFVLVVGPTPEVEQQLEAQRKANRIRAAEQREEAARRKAEKAQDVGDTSKLLPSRVRAVVTPYDRGLPRAGLWRNDVHTADMNGDGILDIVHPPPRKGGGKPAVFFHDGEGNWQFARGNYRARRLEYGDAAIADFNGDGHLDIALAMHLLGTTVLYGRGNLRFQEFDEGFDRPTWARPNSPFGKRAPWASRAMAASDLDGDGDLDLLAIGEGAESLSLLRAEGDPEPLFSEGITVYVNQGDSWSPHRFENLPSGGDRITMGDFDDDGEPEAAVAWASSRGWNVILDFRFEDGKPIVDPQRLESLGNEITFVGGVAAGDIIPGGPDELAVGRMVKRGDIWRGRIELHAREGNRADGAWRAYTLADWPYREGISDIDVGDLDGDGKLDIAAATGASRIVLLRGMGDGRFQLADESLAEVQFNCAAFSIELADLDNDGSDEVISGFAGEDTSVPGIGAIPGCKDSGRLAVWKVERFEEADTEATGPTLDAYEFDFGGPETPESLLLRARQGGR